MRGTDIDQGGLFSYVSMEQRIPLTHPLRRIRALLDEALSSISRDFDRVYAEGGRESVAPERLVRALVLQVLYSIRSERLLCEQLDYNLLFRWFVGLSMDDRIWDHSTFTKNRDRLIEAGVARKLLRRIGRRARREGLLSSEHFSVDGTLIEAWSAVKSMRRRDGKMILRPRVATPTWTSTVNGARMRRTWPRTNRRRSFSRRATARPRSSATWGTC